MKKLFSLLFLYIVIVFPILAQRSKDVIYFKNGSMIYGKLVEATDSTYKLQTGDGSIYVYSKSEVVKMDLNASASANGKSAGYVFSFEGGIMAGAQKSQYKAPFSFNLLLRLTKNPMYMLSAGSGVEFIGQVYAPLFAEYKILLSDKPVAPFLFFRGGMLFHLNGDYGETDQTYPQYNVPINYHGGGTFTMGTGLAWKKEWGETYISFAYRNLHTSYKEKSSDVLISTYKTSYNRLELKIGLRF